MARVVDVLVTRSTRNVGIELIRALAAAGYRVIGADDRRPPLALHSRHVGRFHELPPFESADIGAALIDLVKRVRPAVLVPVGISDVACELQAELGRHCRTLMPDPAARTRVNDKQSLAEICCRLGIPMPRIYKADKARRLLDSETEQDETPRLVVKPRGQVGGGGGVHFVATRRSLDDALAAVRAEFGEPMITEYVRGDADDVRAVHFLFDRHARLVSWFTARKLCLWPPATGLTAAAVSTHEWGLVQQLLPLFRQLEWRGPAEAEFKVDARTGEPLLLEINPRFSGAISFPLRCGVNLAAAFCRAALGETMSTAAEPAYAAGIKYVNPSLYTRVLCRRLVDRGPRRALADLRRDLAGQRAAIVYQLSDFRPTLGKALLQLREPWTGKVDGPHAG